MTKKHDGPSFTWLVLCTDVFNRLEMSVTLNTSHLNFHCYHLFVCITVDKYKIVQNNKKVYTIDQRARRQDLFNSNLLFLKDTRNAASSLGLGQVI